tara:strand:+ start:680 stop:1006 length:327 start_codon:yes stop_codon:yes gene_type:complete
MGRPLGSKNKPQAVPDGSINLTGGANVPTTAAPVKGENTIGKMMRSVTITFAPGTLTVRRSAGGYIACNGRGVDENGVTWNVPTAMPLNPQTGKSCPVDGTDIADFLG